MRNTFRCLVGLVTLALLLVSSGQADALNFTAKHEILQSYGVTKGYAYEGLAVTRAGTYNSNILAGLTQSMSRSGHIATADLRKVRVILANFAIEVMNPAEAAIGASTQTASIEYPAQSGKFTTVTFNGGYTSVTIPSGGIAISDWITPPGLIGVGTKVDLRQWRSSAGGIYYLTNRDAATDDLARDSASEPDLTMGGTITQVGTSRTLPLAIVGMTTAPSVIIIGDSIAWGLNDTATISDGRAGLVARNFPTNLAFLNMGSPGLYAQDGVTKSQSRSQLYYLASHVVSELGVNDFYPGARTPAQVTADLTAQFALFHPRAAFFQGTITPESSSSNSWIDVVNQTALTGNANRITFDTTLRAGGMTGLRGFFEYAWNVEDSHDSGKWNFDGTAFKYTGDGIHPSAFGYAAGTVGTLNSMIFR